MLLCPILIPDVADPTLAAPLRLHPDTQLPPYAFTQTHNKHQPGVASCHLQPLSKPPVLERTCFAYASASFGLLNIISF
jgi:hypothetical protein